MSEGVLEQPVATPAESWADRCLSEISTLSAVPLAAVPLAAAPLAAAPPAAAPPAAAPLAAHEKRASVRSAASGVAIIKPDFGLPITCTLVDRSDGGARLKVLSVLGIPDRFALILEAEQVQARIAWRSVGEIGVAFTPPE